MRQVGAEQGEQGEGEISRGGVQDVASYLPPSRKSAKYGHTDADARYILINREDELPRSFGTLFSYVRTVAEQITRLPC